MTTVLSGGIRLAVLPRMATGELAYHRSSKRKIV